jgi:type II secretory ATPase GspE/PulE/Tfp pilus assembly ATPase PilB-like protein
MGELVKPGSLGYILLNSQIVSEADISAALEEQRRSGCRIGEAFVRLGIVEQEDIDWALSNQLNIPYVRLKKEMIDPAAVELLPGYLCRQYGLMPIIRYGNELSVAMIDPLNSEAIDAVQEVTGCSVTVSVALIRELREMQALFYGEVEGGETLGFISRFFPPEALAKINVDLTGAKLTDYLLGYMVQQNLASLSLQPVHDCCRVVARKKGSARELGSFPLSRYSPIQQRLRRMAGLAEGDNGERGRISFFYKGAELGIQGHFLRMVGGDGITLRPHLTAPFPSSLDDFMTTSDERELLRQLLSLKCGIILCTAGEKNELDRTIDFILDEIADSGKGVALIGQGIGRGRHHFPRVDGEGVGAAEISPLLAALLEHEPEVVAIEEVGEEHLFIAAGKAALKGRLVVGGLPECDLSTLFSYLGHLWRHHHFVPPYLKGVVNCRAVQLLCPSCRQSYLPSGEELAAMGLVNPPERFYAAGGCTECGQSGFAGRKYLLEVIAVTPDLLQTVERSVDGREVVQFLNSRGLTGVRARGVALLDAGEISPHEFISALVL